MSSNDKADKGVIKELQEFYKSSYNFITYCEKPDRKGKLYNYLEFFQISKQCALGFLIMGTIGFVIKLVFLMINNILLS